MTVDKIPKPAVPTNKQREDIKKRRTKKQSQFVQSKRDALMWLLRSDCQLKIALEFVWLPISTFYDRIYRDRDLRDEYEQSKLYSYYKATSEFYNLIYNQWDDGKPLLDNNVRVKYIFERLKRRDDRYHDKIDQKIIPVIIDENELEE